MCSRVRNDSLLYSEKFKLINSGYFVFYSWQFLDSRGLVDSGSKQTLKNIDCRDGTQVTKWIATIIS